MHENVNQISASGPDAAKGETTTTPRKYVPRRFSSEGGGFSENATPEELFLRKLRGTFNKMCSKNTDTTVQQVVESLAEISTNQLSAQIWKDIAKFIAQRAIAEPQFHPAHISICVKVAGTYKSSVGVEDNFGDLIISAYEGELQQRIHTKDVDEDVFGRMREKMLCATKFVGELAKKANIFSDTMTLLAPSLFLLSFLHSPDFDSASPTPMQMACVECACTLLSLIGKNLDMSPNEAVDRVFDTIHTIGENTAFLPRIRFMAKDLAELRQNRWLPRVLTKKADEASAPQLSVTSPAPTPASSLPTTQQASYSSSSNGNGNGVHKESSRDGETSDLSTEDAELQAIMESFVQKLKGKSESCTAGIMRKFVKSITSEQAKVVTQVIAENPDLASLIHPPPRAVDIFIRRSSSTGSLRQSQSPQPLSRNFHAAINLIKLNDASSFSQEMNQSLVAKVEKLKGSELIEVVCSIFRKMCELPGEYNFCLDLCLTLANNAASQQSFQEALENCCQDESALKMFNTQASLNLYLRLVQDLEKKMHMDVEVVKKCVGNVQNGLYELTEEEATLLSSLEDLIAPSLQTSASAPPSFSSPITAAVHRGNRGSDGGFGSTC